MATGQWHWYAGGLSKILNKEVDLDTDTLKIMLLTSSYTPDPAHDYQADLTNEVTGDGYTAGGATLAGVSVSVVAAASLAAWAGTTAYRVGQVRRPISSNGFIYRCIEAGTSGGSEPAWPTTVGETISDGTVTWACVGSHLLKLDATNPSWSNSTITARYAVVVDTTPANPSANPVIGYCDFGENVSSSAGTFSITFDADGFLHIFI